MLLARSNKNVDCCLKNSISASEDGKTYRWPQTSSRGCVGGLKLTFQGWVDDTVSLYQSLGFGLCFEGWRYLVKVCLTDEDCDGQGKCVNYQCVSESPSTTTETVETGTPTSDDDVWLMEVESKWCTNNDWTTSVSTILDCQNLCLEKTSCTGISYSYRLDFVNTCFLCKSSGVSSNSYGFSFYRRPVDGAWSNWASFSTCSKSCGTGYRTRTRSCTNPSPMYDGKYCFGESFDIQDCNTNPCED